MWRPMGLFREKSPVSCLPPEIQSLPRFVKFTKRYRRVSFCCQIKIFFHLFLQFEVGEVRILTTFPELPARRRMTVSTEARRPRRKSTDQSRGKALPSRNSCPIHHVLEFAVMLRTLWRKVFTHRGR